MKINGSIELVQDAGNVGVAFIKNAIIERLSSAPTGITGRLYYDSTSNAYFCFNGTAWHEITTSLTSVISFSAGTTGLTPSTTTSGTVVLGGVLNVSSGGTGLTSAGASGNVISSNSSAFVSSPIHFIYDSALHAGAKKAFKITHNLNQQFVNVTVFDRTQPASAAITGVSTGSSTFTVATNMTATFTAGLQFAVFGSTGNDGTYTVVSSSFAGGNTTITVQETVSSAIADGTIYAGPSQIIPQQVLQVDANNLIVTLNLAINVYVVITGITGVSAA